MSRILAEEFKKKKAGIDSTASDDIDDDMDIYQAYENYKRRYG